MTRSRSQLSDEDDDLYSYFNNSVSAVQAHADHFEQEYARPALKTSQVFLDEHPIAASFVVIFAFLSFIPVASFLGLALFAVGSITIMALTTTIIVSAIVVLTLLSLLLLTLITTLIASALLTLSGIAVYSFASLFNLVRTHGRLGVSRWIERMSELVLGNVPAELSSPRIHGHDPGWTDSEDVQHEADVKQEVLDTPYLGSSPDILQSEDEPNGLA